MHRLATLTAAVSVLFVGLTISVVTATPASATGIITQLGAPPTPCAPPGCNTETQGPPEFLDWTYYGNLHLSEHLIPLGSDVIATGEGETGGHVAWDTPHGDFETISGCGNGPACTLKATSPTISGGMQGGWAMFATDMCGFFGCAPSGDYYYITSDPAIEGYVLDESGAPVSDPTIQLNGATLTNYDPQTGYYSAIVQPGSYDVTASVGGQSASVDTCSGTINGHTCSVTLQNGANLANFGHGEANFVVDDEPSISGQVTTHNGTGVSGVTVNLAAGACFDLSTGCASVTVTTNATGFYSTDVDPGSYTVTLSGLGSNSRSDPSSQVVGVNYGDHVTENFLDTTAPVVDLVQDQAGPTTGGDILTVTGSGFGSQGSADTVQFCTASGSCLSGISPVVQSDTTLSVTTPDATSLEGGQPNLVAFVEVTNTSSETSAPGPTSAYEFGCQQDNLTAGPYSESSCFANSPGSPQYQTTGTTNWDGTQLQLGGGSGTDADVNTTSDAYTSNAASSLALNLGNSQLVTLLTGLTNVNLSQTTITLNAAANVSIGGFPISGSVTINSQNQTTMTITASVQLPTIFGGSTGTLVLTTVQGTGVTTMNITVNAGQQQSLAGIFSLSGLTLTWTRATQTWTVSATGNAQGNAFTLNGNLTYGSTGITNGALKITGNVSLASGVISFQNINFTYNAGAWSASASVTQATGSMTFSLSVDKNGNITQGQVMSNGPVTLFGVVTLQSFMMTYSNGTWAASATTGQNGQNSISVQVDPSKGGIQSFGLTLQNITLGSAVNVSKLSISYSNQNNTPIYSGTISVKLNGSGIGIGGNISFKNGAFQSGGLNFQGLHIPIGSSGAFIVGGGADIKLGPPIVLTGDLQLEFGPSFDGIAAFGADGMISYTFGTVTNGVSTPASVTLSGAVAAGGVPGQGSAITLGNGSLTLSGGGTGSLCVGLGAAGLSGCASSAGFTKFGETLTGVLNATFSTQAAQLTGQVGAKGTLLTGSAGFVVNTTGIAACTSGGTHGFSYLWGSSGPTAGCPTTGFSIPGVTSASSSGGDPTTGLNVAQGGTVHVTAAGFLAGETVDATLASNGDLLGAATAGPDGSVTIQGTVGATEALGPDALVLQGQTSGLIASLPLMVAPAASSAPTQIELLGPTSVVAGGSVDLAALADGTAAPTYALTDAPGWLSIDPATGEITGTEPNNGETSFTFEVTATNDSGSFTSSPETVGVTPDAAPTTVLVTAPTTVAPGDGFYGQASADGTPSATFSLSDAPGWLSIDPASGELYGTEPNDGETSFSFAVTATNAAGGATSSTDTVTVAAATAPDTVTITGPSSTDVGQPYAAQVTDDGIPQSSYALASGPSWLSVDAVTGAVSGTPTSAGGGSFSYTVTATNEAGSATSATQTVTLVPDEAPDTVTVTAPASIAADSAFQAQATSDGTPDATYALVDAPSWLTIDPDSGIITGGEPDNGETSFTFSVTATNEAGSATSEPVTVDVTEAPTFISATPPLTVAPGGDYAASFTAAGLPDAPTYALGAGAPGWLTINATTGAVSGTEPNDGEFAFTYSVVATNSQGSAVAGPFTVAVNIAPTFTADSPPTAVTNLDNVDYQFAAEGGPDGVTFSLETTATWLTIDSATGELSGTDPGGQASFTYTVLASDDEGTAVAGPFTIFNDEAPIFDQQSPSLTVAPTATYSAHFFAEADPDAATYSLAGAPAWLSVNPTTGEVTGTTPAETGSFTYAVVATNSVGSAETSTFTVQIENIPIITAQSPALTVPAGGSYSYDFSAQNPPGTSGSLTWELTNGDPGWLTINASTGALSGTEPNNGESSFTYSVAVYNSVGTSIAGPFTVSVDLAPVFTEAIPSTSLGTDYESYTAQFTAQALPDPPTYALVGAPDWLTIDATSGLVSGVEPDHGTAPFSYSVMATNSQGSTTVGPFPVTFGPPQVTGVINESTGTVYGAFSGNVIKVSGAGLTYSSVDLYVGSCSNYAGTFLAEVTSNDITYAPNGSSMTFSVPDLTNLHSWYECPDGTIPFDVDVQGPDYLNQSDNYETLWATAGEPTDEVFSGYPSALPTPTVTSVTNSSTGTDQVPIAGGTPITITGSGFTDVSALTFTDASCMPDAGSTVATYGPDQFSVSGDGTTITTTSPPDVAEAQNGCGDGVDLDVQVTLSAPPSNVTSQSFINEPETELSLQTPTVIAVTDTTTGTNEGPAQSGDTFQVTGTNLEGASSVEFVDSSCAADPGTVSQTIPAGDLTVSSDGTTVTFTNPGEFADVANVCPSGQLTVDVVVNVTDATGATDATPTSSADQFTFDYPTVTGIENANTGNDFGPLVGGETVQISGTGLGVATAVVLTDDACTPVGGQVITTIPAGGLTIAPDGSSVSFTSPGDEAQYADACNNNGSVYSVYGVYADAAVTITDPTTGATGQLALGPQNAYVFAYPAINGIENQDTTTVPINGDVSLHIWGSGLTNTTAIQFLLNGQVEGTVTDLDVSDDFDIEFPEPNLAALEYELGSSTAPVTLSVRAITADPDAPGGELIDDDPYGVPQMTFTKPIVTGVKTAQGAPSGPLTGGEALTITGTGLEDASAVQFQYTNATGGVGTVTVPVVGTNDATSLTVTAPNLGDEVGLPGANDLALAHGAHTILTNVRVVDDGATASQNITSAKVAADHFSITVPARTRPRFTSVDHATEPHGHAFSVTVSATQYALISFSGSHPSWLHLTADGDGMATLSGTPPHRATTHVTLEAKNGTTPNAVQRFTLTAT